MDCTCGHAMNVHMNNADECVGVPGCQCTGFTTQIIVPMLYSHPRRVALLVKTKVEKAFCICIAGRSRFCDAHPDSV